MNSTLALSDARITIAGMGLMGGSLALALRGKCAHVTGVDVDASACAAALAGQVVQAAESDLHAGIADAHLLILATPVGVILQQLQVLKVNTTARRAGLVVLDLGSTKTEIVAAMETLPAACDPVGGHPMCGKEVAGLQHADAALYHGATFVLAPLARTSPAALQLAHAVVAAVGAHALLLDAARHDRLAAATSHVPYLIACALMSAASAAAVDDDALWKLAASGFRDTSRLAASSVTMMLDILRTNRAPVRAALLAQREQIDRLAGLLEGDEAALAQFLHGMRSERRRRFPVKR
ncbi:MAG: prephenate dehydrogenase [Chloroflexi bacterium]|nr:MAG: prephenate dehydrogenase [Chloroflexota bacterium]